MAVDNTIRFNSHNSYKVTSQVFCYPFGVQGQSYVTHSFQAYCTSMLSSATRAKTKFFASDGSLVSENSHAFAVTTVFGIVEITVAVPATAVQAQLMFIQGGTDWWFAEPKSEYGESATPYAVNYTNQLTYITPTGIYTGMITTSQIVVTGSVASPDETLDTRLVTINNGVINLSSTLSAKTTKITNEGVYTGEVRADQITVGQIQGPQLADGSVSDVKIASGLSATKITAGKLQSVDGTSYFDLTNGIIKSNNVELTGKITATSGSIGAWNISSNKLISTNGRLSLDPVSEQIVLGDVTLKDVSVGGSYGKVRMSSTQTSDDIVFMITNNTSSPTGFNARVWVETPVKDEYAFLDSHQGLQIWDGDDWWGISRVGVTNLFSLKVDMIRIGGNIYTLTRDANGFLKAI